MNKIKTYELALILGMAAAVFFAGFGSFTEDYRGITQTVFRLHILANSDSEADQPYGRVLSTAQRVVHENGSDYEVKCEVTRMDFGNRVYGDITMPAGEYSALRITIGEAAGKNWWCVMFPLEGYDGVFTEEELEMLHNPENYECRFYFLDLYEKIKNKICA